MFSTKTTALIIFFLFITNDAAVSQSTQSFVGLIQRIAAEEPSKRSAIVDSFMIAQKPKGFPITTDSMAYFVYRGKVDSAIAVTGDYTQWPATGDAMTNVSATDLFYAGRKFEPDARIDYKFIKDGNWILDPLNGHIVSGGFGRNSELAMPCTSSRRPFDTILRSRTARFQPLFLQALPPETAEKSRFIFRRIMIHRRSVTRQSTFTTGPIIFPSHQWQTCSTI